MRIVLAPDSFKESMSAATAAAAMARGVRTVHPDAVCVEVPMADGGEGTAAALVAALGGEWRTVPTTDPLGRPVSARCGLVGEGLGVLEVAAAVGLGLIAPPERDVWRSTSLGVAGLVRDALDAGASRLLVGLGGTATTDGGAGLLAGLGARWLDQAGRELVPTPAGLSGVCTVDLAGLDPRLAGVGIELACDVDNPLLGARGAAAVFGPQKGATPEQVPLLDSLLRQVADALAGAGLPDVREWPGAGAAGGLGAAFLALGARLRPGVEVVAEAAGLEAAVAGADLVLTGEGSLDAQSLAGKTPVGVAAIAARHGVPVVVFAGRVVPGTAELLGERFASVVALRTEPAELPVALREGAADLERAVAATLRGLAAAR